MSETDKVEEARIRDVAAASAAQAPTPWYDAQVAETGFDPRAQ